MEERIAACRRADKRQDGGEGRRGLRALSPPPPLQSRTQRGGPRGPHQPNPSIIRLFNLAAAGESEGGSAAEAPPIPQPTIKPSPPPTKPIEIIVLQPCCRRLARRRFSAEARGLPPLPQKEYSPFPNPPNHDPSKTPIYYVLCLQGVPRSAHLQGLPRLRPGGGVSSGELRGVSTTSHPSLSRRSASLRRVRSG